MLSVLKPRGVLGLVWSEEAIRRKAGNNVVLEPGVPALSSKPSPAIPICAISLRYRDASTRTLEEGSCEVYIDDNNSERSSAPALVVPILTL